jgi:hypothetical protein
MSVPKVYREPAPAHFAQQIRLIGQKDIMVRSRERHYTRGAYTISNALSYFLLKPLSAAE